MPKWFRSTPAIVIIGVLVLGAAALLFYFQRPAAVVNRSLRNVGTLASADFTTTLELANNQVTEQTLGERGTLEVMIDGVYQRHTDTPDTLSADVTLTTKTESVSVQIEGEVRLIEDQAYLHITRAPAALPIVPQLKGKWFSLPRRSEATTVTDQDEPPVLVENVARVGREKVGDTSTVKYTAAATPEAVINFMDVIADILGTSLTDQQITEIRQGVTAGSSVPLEVWVEAGSRLKQLSATLDLANGNVTRLTVRINERNNDVDVPKPSDVQSLLSNNPPSPPANEE